MAQIPEEIKDAAQKKSTVKIIEYFRAITTNEEFVAIKEHKIFFKLGICKDLEAVRGAYIQKISEISPSMKSEEENYLKFVALSLSILTKIEDQLKKPLKIINKYDEFGTLQTFAVWISQKSDDINRDIWNQFDKAYVDKLQPDDKAVYINHLIHCIHGVFIDYSNATARGLNLIFKQHTQGRYNLKNGNVPKSAVERLTSQLKIYEHISHLIDLVSYGDLKIKNISHSEVEFSFVDISYEVAKKVGMRSIISDFNFKQNKEKTIHRMFENVAVDVALGFKNFLQDSEAGYISEDILIDKIKKELVNHLDFQDELLFISFEKQDKYILAIFLVGIILRSLAVTIDQLVTDIYRFKVMKHFFEIPIDIIKSYTNAIINEPNIVEKAINYYVTCLPIKSSGDLICKPYIKMSDNRIFGIMAWARSSNWTLSLRRDLIKGGKSAKSYGDYWEEYIEQIFTTYSWNILGKQIKIRSKDLTLTDIDLVVEKNGLLLFIQAKAVTECRTPYEYWLAKNTLKKGVQQAKLSLQNLTLESEHLKVILRRKNINLNEIKIIHSIVIIPSRQFSGWVIRDVPILSLNYLMSIFKGAKSEVKNNKGETLSTTEFMSPTQTPEELLNLLVNPYFNQVYMPRAKEIMHELLIFDTSFKIPEIV